MVTDVLDRLLQEPVTEAGKQRHVLTHLLSKMSASDYVWLGKCAFERIPEKISAWEIEFFASK